MAPTIDDVDHGSGSRALVLGTGTAAIVLAAVMVLALTPPRSSAPSAVSATTIAMATQAQNVERASLERTPGIVRMHRNTASLDSALTLTGAPKDVSSAPEARADLLDLADSLPGDGEQIFVLTSSHAFRISWSEIDRVAAPDGAMVVTRDGELVAEFVDGALRLLVD